MRVLCGERGAKGHDVEPAILVRVRQAGQEQVAPALVMAIQLAVRGDQDERHALLPTVRSVAMERRRQGGQDVLPGEPILMDPGMSLVDANLEVSQRHFQRPQSCCRRSRCRRPHRLRRRSRQRSARR